MKKMEEMNEKKEEKKRKEMERKKKEQKREKGKHIMDLVLGRLREGGKRRRQ